MASIVFEPTIVLPDSREMPRKLWTRDQCRELMEQGYLEEAGYELIQGEIVTKMGQNEPHVYVCTRVFLKLLAIFGENAVRLPAPVAVNDYNEPDPDLSVVKGSLRDYLLMGTPQPQDMLLVVEVSDATLRKDMTVKATLYAQAGIQEYWVVNINARTLEVFRQPTWEGYADLTSVHEDELLSPLAAPDAAIRIAEILP